MSALRITRSDLSAAKAELDGVNVNTAALSVCHDSMSVFGDVQVGDLVYRVQQLAVAAATSLGEATAAQSALLKQIDDTMETADKALAAGAQ